MKKTVETFIIVLSFLLLGWVVLFTYKGITYQNEAIDLEETEKKITYDLSKMDSVILSLEKEYIDLYKKFKDTDKIINKDNHVINEYGLLTYSNDKSESSAVLTGIKEIDDNLINKFYITEPIGKEFEKYYNLYPQVEQFFVLDKTGYLRIYPKIDILTMIDPKTSFTEYDYYKEESKIKWINTPYFDPLGRGWLISLVKPMKLNNELIGVLGIDFNLNKFNQKYLDKNQVIINDEGYILSGGKNALENLEVSQLKKYQLYDRIMKTKKRDSEYNLLNSPNKRIRNFFKNFLDNPKNKYTVKFNKKFKIIVKDLDIIDSYLIEFIAL